MNKIIKRIIITGLALGLCLALFATIFIIYTVSTIPIERFSDKIQGQSEKVVRPGSNFEEGSLVRKSDFETYFNFTSERPSFNEWLEERETKGEIEPVNRADLLIHKGFTLPAPQENDCPLVYCYQSRIPFGEIPSVFWMGLIGIEDIRFLDHFGVDFKSIMRAIITDIKEMKFVQGGSTLTQQIVKNLFFTNEKKLSRKLKEIIYSVYIENIYSKEDILEAYFNEVFWGALQGVRIKGITAASIFYFNKRPHEVTPYEASILISLLKGPNYYSPIRRTHRLRDRADVVFGKLVSLGHLSPRAIKWGDKHWEKWKDEFKRREKDRPAYQLWESIGGSKANFEPYERFVFSRSVKSIDEFLKIRVGDKRPNIAIKAIIGDVTTDTPFYYYSKVERDRNKAIEEERHLAGSTLKPLIYGVFLDHGKRADDLVSLEKFTLKLKSGKWSPKEAHLPEELEITLREALLHSYNRPVISVANELGFDAIEKDVLGYIPSMKTPLGEFPSQLLGGVELSLKELYGTYKKFVNDECSKQRGEEGDNSNNVLFMLSDPNQTTVRKVVEGPMKNMRFFGKTGTSNNGLDAWYVFFDGKNLGSIWVGFEGDRRGVDLNLYGGGTAFRIYQYFATLRGKQFNEFQCRGPLQTNSL